MCIIYTVKRTPCRVDLKPIGHKLSWCGNQYHEFQYLYKCITFLGGLRDTLNPFNSKLITLILRGGLWTFSWNLVLCVPRRDICFDGPVDKANCINAFEHVLICTPDFIRGGYAIKFRNTHYIKPVGQPKMWFNWRSYGLSQVVSNQQYFKLRRKLYSRKDFKM